MMEWNLRISEISRPLDIFAAFIIRKKWRGGLLEIRVSKDGLGWKEVFKESEVEFLGTFRFRQERLRWPTAPNLKPTPENLPAYLRSNLRSS